ncbi:MAG: T9SS type A sorting domain-containing protein [Bacteroidetes bacterium]|nr:T9SS type A sorting domain-containing protein [Bacteroidota bacterium]
MKLKVPDILSLTKKRVLIFCITFLFLTSVNATTRTWAGGSSGTWFVAGNWSPVGTPSVNDTVVININTVITVDVNPVIAALNITGLATVSLTSAANRSLSIGNGGTPARVFYIETGSSLTIGSISGVSIVTYGSLVTNTALINGLLVLGQGPSTWVVNALPLSLTNTTINGTVRMASNNSGSGVLSGTTTTLRFTSGSVLDWQRNGGAGPNAQFQDGSIINVTGITNSMVSFNSAAQYNGLLIWNCTSQTSSGSSALLLPSTSASMDSIRILSTGTTGSLRLATNPAGFSIGHLDIRGGQLELSAPGAAFSNGTILNDFVISNGVVRGNATYTGDNLSAYPMTLSVNGDFIMTGGTLDFTNRPLANAPSGAFILNVLGNVNTISPSLIVATSGFASQNQLNMIGPVMQSLALNSFNNTISLVIDNPAGVDLQTVLPLPYSLFLNSGYLQLNNNDVYVNASLINRTNGKVVTNGTGALTLDNVTTTGNFYIGPDASSYNPVTITSGSGNSFTARVAGSINDPSVAIPADAVLRTWYLQSSANTSVGASFVYANAHCSPGASAQPLTMELLQSDYLAWSLSAGNTAITPTGADPAWTVSTMSNLNLTTTPIPFAIGVSGTAILAAPCRIVCSAKTAGQDNLIQFNYNNCAALRSLEVQRADAGNQFRTVGLINPSPSQNDYQYTDPGAATGTWVYRIKGSLPGGRIVYSNNVRLSGSEQELLSRIYPNPVEGVAMLQLSIPEEETVTIFVTDISGRVYLTKTQNLNKGSHSLPLDLSRLAKGNYLIYIVLQRSGKKAQSILVKD